MGTRYWGLGTGSLLRKLCLKLTRLDCEERILVPGPRSPVPVLISFSLFCLLSCGLEDIPYLDYIDDTLLKITDNTSASIQLPSSSAEGYGTPNYFVNFMIYYRIYISNAPESGEINTSDLRSRINSSLNSDFSSLYNLTDKTSTSANPSNLESTFNGRKYFKLVLEGSDIDNVLGSGSLGRTLDIQFLPINGEKPVLILNGVSYTLQRAVSGPSLEFNPVPDNRYFLNHPDLYNTENVKDNINADVATSTQTDIRYTYVSMYIFAVGKNPESFTTIYSQPTHINIFRLAEAY